MFLALRVVNARHAKAKMISNNKAENGSLPAKAPTVNKEDLPISKSRVGSSKRVIGVVRQQPDFGRWLYRGVRTPADFGPDQ
jgi:hypothetical protein